MADTKALQAIGFGFSAIMVAVLLRAVIVVTDASRTADAPHAVAELSPLAATTAQ